MRYRQAIFVLAIAAATLLQTGCGTPGNGATKGGSGSGAFDTYTLMASGGTWANATVYGNADPSTAPCNSSDIHCFLSFPDYGTGQYGVFQFSTDALPATWDATGKPDLTCSSGGYAPPQEISNGGYLQVICGTLNGTETEATPNSCTVIYVNGVLQGQCAPYLVVTTTNPVLPTSYALTAGWYSDEAVSEGSSQNNASSSTQITVPAPANWGLNVITIVDPTTNEVLGATDYVLHECFITAGQYGESENCPY
jgi:hypothetical protein